MLQGENSLKTSCIHVRCMSSKEKVRIRNHEVEKRSNSSLKRKKRCLWCFFRGNGQWRTLCSTCMVQVLIYKHRLHLNLFKTCRLGFWRSWSHVFFLFLIARFPWNERGEASAWSLQVGVCEAFLNSWGLQPLVIWPGSRSTRLKVSFPKKHTSPELDGLFTNIELHWVLEGKY